MENKTFEIEGFNDLMKAIDELPNTLQTKIVRTVLYKAAKKFIVNNLRSAVSYSNKLKKSIRVVNMRNDKLAVKAGVIISRDPENKIPAGVIIRFVDGGTVQRTTKRGYNRGAIRARNEVEPVINQNLQPMSDYITDEFANEINNELDKRLRKINK